MVELTLPKMPVFMPRNISSTCLRKRFEETADEWAETALQDESGDDDDEP